MSWILEAGGVYDIKGEKVFGRNLFVTPEKIEDVKKRFKNTDAYASIFMYSEKNQDKSHLYGPLYIDLDIDIKNDFDYGKIRKDLLHVVTALNNVFKVPYEYIKIYFSGNKGFHVIVPPEIFGIEPSTNLNEEYKLIANELKRQTLFKTVDTRIYDRKRLFRLPNTINGKTGLYKTPIDLENARVMTYKDLSNYATQPHYITYPEPKTIKEAERRYKDFIKKAKAEQKKTAITANFKFKKDKLPKCIINILNDGAVKGSRNNVTVVLASSLLQHGNALDDVIATLIKWNEEKNDIPLPEGELINTIHSANKGIQGGKKYGCSAIRDLGLCDPKCSIISNK